MAETLVMHTQRMFLHNPVVAYNRSRAIQDNDLYIRIVGLSWEVSKSSRHPTRSDFEPLLSFQFCVNAGGYA